MRLDGSEGTSLEEATLQLEQQFEEDGLGALPPVGTMDDLDVEQIRVEHLAVADGGHAHFDFVSMFRRSTPYIKMHQGKTVVIHIASEVLEQGKLFDEIMDDIAVLALLGIRPVLFMGTRLQVDQRLQQKGIGLKYHGVYRISDEETMRVVQEVSQYWRARAEGALSRGRARSGPSGSVGVDVVSGNFFYSAQPVGVRNGVDFGQTGEVRRVDTDKMNQHLKRGEIVLMTTLGYSASGEVFNCKTASVASRVAAALGASKLMFLTPAALVRRREGSRPTTLQSLRMGEARNLVHYYREASANPYTLPAATTPSAAATPAGHLSNGEIDPASNPSTGTPQDSDEYTMTLLAQCVEALEKGVTRAHLIPAFPGSLLQELYTTDGSGTLIARDLYEGIRLATPADVPGMLELIQPLKAKGILVPRRSDSLLCDVHAGFYYVCVRDTTILACSMLKRHSATKAEIGCLVVDERYRREGRGESMLSFLERTAVASGVQKLFLHATLRMQWFLERGFTEAPLEVMPRRTYAHLAFSDQSSFYSYLAFCNSKIYQKEMVSVRQVDAEELFWMHE